LPNAAILDVRYLVDGISLRDWFLNTSSIREWLEIAGLMGVVASLVFVGLEVRQSRQIASMDQLAVARQLVSDYRQQLIEHADLWYRGCSGEELSDSERFVFGQLALELRDTVATLYGRGNIGIYTSTSRWMDNFAVNLHRYPAIQRAIFDADGASVIFPESTDISEFAGGAFVGLPELISQRVSQLKTLKPEASAPSYFCGNL
jgi:hypothetical protein